MEDQTTTGSSGQAPGWDADPYRRHELRYWDGDAWTDHVSDRGVNGVDPPDTGSPWAAMSATAAAPVTAVPAPSSPSVVATTPPPTPPPTPTPARPPGPSWAWQPAPTPTSSPGAPLPAPAWATPPRPAPPPHGMHPGVATVPTRRGRARWWVVAAAALVVIIIAGGYVIFRPPSRIDAGPPAATPAGFRIVRTGDYSFAVPAAWQDRELTGQDRDQIASRLDQLAPGSGGALNDASDSLDGAMVVAIDPTNRENVNVAPFHWMRGDPSDPGTLAEIRSGIARGAPGTTISGLTTAPADVHGYPAATLTYALTIGSISVHQVSTVIQTGDHVFQVTVTAFSPERASELSGQIVPTFDPS